MSRLLHLGIAGAGPAGAVLARELADAGHRVSLFEERSHVAGNCHTERDAHTGVLVHVYGPHIFHTPHERVWRYVTRFARFRPYEHRVKAIARDRVYVLPVNLHTINQFFGTTHSPAQARAFVAARVRRGDRPPATFEEQALAFVGPELYAAFFEGYTRKQWGVDPGELPASILKRLPLRFNYDDRYFSHPFQGIPEEGYTALVERILDHPNIEVRLGTKVTPEGLDAFDHAFWTGPIDACFDHRLGRLPYRTLDFETEVHGGDFQGCAVMNYCDAEVPFTRISEHKHFAPWEAHEETLVYREFSRDCGAGDIPYYPLRLAREKALLARYVALAGERKGISFLGRLGTYRYLDMDATILESLEAAGRCLESWPRGESIPVFFRSPLD